MNISFSYMLLNFLISTHVRLHIRFVLQHFTKLKSYTPQYRFNDMNFYKAKCIS